MEVYHNGEWGTVCNDGWTLNAAQVVCREIGFDSAIKTLHYGQGSGQIWLDNVVCIGNESSIEKCSHGGWGIHDCTHSEDVGVQCSPEGIITFTSYIIKC